MRRQLVCMATALAVVIASVHGAAAGSAHRQLGAHEHGSGTLNVAVEGDRVSLELAAPGADIVGFEHAPQTDQQKAEHSKAGEKLKAGLTLFRLTPQAGCELVEYEIDHVSEAHVADIESATAASDHAHDHDEHEDAGHDHDHAEFLVSYSIRCETPAELRGIAFDYFNEFKNAQRLQVNVVTAKGQSAFTATRDAPMVSFGDLN